MPVFDVDAFAESSVSFSSVSFCCHPCPSKSNHHFFRLIMYCPKLALRGDEAFELLCFSCGLECGGTSTAIVGCVDALFYIALTLQAAQVPQLSACPGVDAALSVDHNAIVLLR